MTPEATVIVAETLNKLPFVKWDRFTEVPDGDIDVYGWIERDDGRSDFVALTFPTPVQPDYVGFQTSSAEYTHKIHEILFGETEVEHIECQRIDVVLGDLVTRKTVQT